MDRRRVSKGLYGLIRARGAFRTLVFDDEEEQDNWWFVPLLVLTAPLMWAASDGEPWRWVYPLVPIACVAGSLRAPRGTERSEEQRTTVAKTLGDP